MRCLPSTRCFLSATQLAFGEGPYQRNLTLTFGFLWGLVRILVVLTGIWALAAGVLQTGRLVATIPADFPGMAAGGWWAEQAPWAAPLLGVPFYALKAFGACLLVALASAMAGALFGFLFGVPRPISEDSQSAARTSASGAGGTNAGDGASGGPAGGTSAGGSNLVSPQRSDAARMRRWQSSTNLTQISDWLTKVIVGVGLVDARDIYGTVAGLANTAALMMFDGYVGSKLVVPSLMIAGAIIGFLYSYLFTQLFLAGLLAYADDIVKDPSSLNARSVISSIATGGSVIAGPILGNGHVGIAASAVSAGGLIAVPLLSGRYAEPLPVIEPTAAQREAASTLDKLPLEGLEDPAEIQIWARAQAVRRDYADASRGYRKLLRFWHSAEVKAEAARVFYANNEIDDAETLLGEAIAGRKDVPPEVRSRITFDAASLALYEPPPVGYMKALALLDADTLTVDTYGALHILRACATAQRYSHDKTLSDDEKALLRASVLADVRIGLIRDNKNRVWVRYLADPNAEQKKGLDPAARDSDLEPFFNDADFQKLLDASPGNL